jgi:hypothetical protein
MRASAWLSLSVSLGLLSTMSVGCSSPSDEGVRQSSDPIQTEGRVNLFAAPDCAGSAYTTIGPATDCSSLSDTWTQSIEVGGVCTDIQGQYTRSACFGFKAADVLLYSATGCTGPAYESIGPSTDCSSLSDTWTQSIKVGGVCTDIQGQYTRSACFGFKGSDVLLYAATDCSGPSYESIGPTTDCSSLSDTWTQSIKVRGACTNIQGQYTRSACFGFKAADVLLYSATGCTGPAYESVGPSTDCSSLSDTWTQSIKVGGTCTNIPGQYTRSACVTYKGSP